MKGELHILNNPILNRDVLESGTIVISCDHTINSILERANKL